MGKLLYVNILGIVATAYIFFWYMDYTQKSQEELALKQISSAVDNAGKASMYTLLETRTISLDYEDLNYVDGDPQQALDMYIDVLLMNMGMSLSEENKHYVRTSYMPTFVVALTDGYYIARQEKVKDGAYGEYDLVLSPKLGYSYKHNNNIYGLRQGASYYYSMNDVNDIDMTKDLARKEGFPPGLTSKREVHEQIGKILTGAMAEVIESYAEDTNTQWAADFYLPAELTTNSKVNAVEGPTVITILQGVDANTVEPIDTYSVTGARTEFARVIVGYTDNTGKKYYSYADTIPTNLWGSGYTIIEPFQTMNDAARAGYIADQRYIHKTRRD